MDSYEWRKDPDELWAQYRAKIEARQKHLDGVLSALPDDLRSTLQTGLLCIQRYCDLADEDAFNRHGCIVRPCERELILKAAESFYSQSDWYGDRDVFAPVILREIVECRRTGGGDFIPESYSLDYDVFDDSEDIHKFKSAFSLVQAQSNLAHRAVVTSCAPCSRSLMSDWQVPKEYEARPPGCRAGSGVGGDFSDLDFTFLMGHRAVLPAVDCTEIENELCREARAAADARLTQPWFRATGLPPAPILEHPLDNLVTLNQVAPLAGVSKRSLERHLKNGKLPDPDVRGGGGKPNKWLWKNLRPKLAAIADRPLPEQFPAGRII